MIFSQKSSDRIQIEHIKSIYKSTYNVLGYAVYHIYEIENWSKLLHEIDFDVIFSLR